MQLILSFAKPARHFLPHGLAGENERDLHQIMEMNTGMLCKGAVLPHDEPPLIGRRDTQRIVFRGICLLHDDG